ncbi:MAG: hypothetical protein RL457_1373 [Pseudomonadota bacterium]|jgi:hypothetical protein
MGLLRKISLSLIFALAICMGSLAHSQGIVVKQAELEKIDAGWLLNANFSIALPAGLENALKKGVTLHFVTEFQLTHGRWYWFDEKAVKVERQIRLSHQPLINQYRITVGDFTFSAASLAEALRVTGTVGGWSVIEAAAISPTKQYEAAVRLTLDLGKLPKPFQVDALNSKDWSLSGEWLRFPFNATMGNVVGRK